MLFLLRIGDRYLHFTRVHISCFYRYWLFRDCQNLLNCLSELLMAPSRRALTKGQGQTCFSLTPKLTFAAQRNTGVMSLSHLTVFKRSYFLWGSLVWCKDSKPSYCTMTTRMLRASLHTDCRWTSALSPSRDVLLSVDCVAGHQWGNSQGNSLFGEGSY